MNNLITNIIICVLLSISFCGCSTFTYESAPTDSTDSIECPTCKGSGYTTRCPICYGNGKCVVNDGSGYSYKEICTACSGLGTTPPVQCAICKGTGRIWEYYNGKLRSNERIISGKTVSPDFTKPVVKYENELSPNKAHLDETLREQDPRVVPSSYLSDDVDSPIYQAISEKDKETRSSKSSSDEKSMAEQPNSNLTPSAITCPDESKPVNSQSSKKTPGLSQRTNENRLKELKSLKEQGLITEDEYQTKRQAILDQL